jgi:hypothetical protein
MIDQTATNRRRNGSRMMGSVVAALAVAIGVYSLSPECFATELSGSMQQHELATLLAAYSENIVSESTMAGQSGTGLQPPSVVPSETTGAPKVMLWDEIKTSPILSPAQDGVVTGGVGGR